MAEIRGINYEDAVRALEKAGFRSVQRDKHVILNNGKRQVTIPRRSPVNACTMAGVVRDAGLTVEEFLHRLL
jgi:predicted RNA binding protein YcfA (HicA-like mRNA interferase family)